MNPVKSNNLTESEIDLLIESIILNNNLIFEKNVEDNLKKYKQQIIEVIISNDYVELIPKLKKIYSYDLQNITDALITFFPKINSDSIEWICVNELEIFINCINKINVDDFMNFIDSDNFYSIYESVKKNKNMLNNFEYKITHILENILINPKTNTYISPFKNFKFLNIIEKVIFLIDIYLRNNPNNNNNFNTVHSKIVLALLKTNTSLELIIKYKKYYKITDKNLKIFFEKSDIFEKNVRFCSVEIVSWFFEIASVLTIIKPSNYITIFKQACLNGDIKLIKLTYNLIYCAGYKIDNHSLFPIMIGLIHEQRWMGNKTNYDDVIYEFINMGIKPPAGISKYLEYYNNITIIKK